LIAAIKNSRVGKNARRLIVGLSAAVVGLLISFAACTYWASQRAPAFYREALSAAPAESAEQGERFERAALALHNNSQQAGRWELSFSADEINGWLTTELPTKFPRLLPAGVSDPRVAIDGKLFHIAVHYNRGGVDTVLSIAGEAYLTAQTNEVAIRLEQARAGLVPIPLGPLIQEINDRAERSDVNLRWTEVKGSPVALLRLPLDFDGEDRRVVLDRLDTTHGHFLIAGRTELWPKPSADNQQPATAGQSDKVTRQR